MTEVLEVGYQPATSDVAGFFFPEIGPLGQIHTFNYHKLGEIPNLKEILKTRGIFDEQVARKPDLYPWAQQFIDAMWSGHWTPNEFNFLSDVQNFKVDLTDEERAI